MEDLLKVDAKWVMFVKFIGDEYLLIGTFNPNVLILFDYETNMCKKEYIKEFPISCSILDGFIKIKTNESDLVYKIENRHLILHSVIQPEILISGELTEIKQEIKKYVVHGDYIFSLYNNRTLYWKCKSSSVILENIDDFVVNTNSDSVYYSSYNIIYEYELKTGITFKNELNVLPESCFVFLEYLNDYIVATYNNKVSIYYKKILDCNLIKMENFYNYHSIDIKPIKKTGSVLETQIVVAFEESDDLIKIKTQTIRNMIGKDRSFIIILLVLQVFWGLFYSTGNSFWILFLINGLFFLRNVN